MSNVLGMVAVQCNENVFKIIEMISENHQQTYSKAENLTLSIPKYDENLQRLQGQLGTLQHENHSSNTLSFSALHKNETNLWVDNQQRKFAHGSLIGSGVKIFDVMNVSSFPVPTFPQFSWNFQSASECLCNSAFHSAMISTDVEFEEKQLSDTVVEYHVVNRKAMYGALHLIIIVCISTFGLLKVEP